MKRILVLSAVVALVIAFGWTDDAMAGFGGWRSRTAAAQSQGTPWHGQYYDTAWGVPVAVVVPPTAENQVHYGWGVGATRVTPIKHQYGRGYPGDESGRVRFRPTPAWPSSTDQLGDYYIRAPW